jgi:serine/threonine protein kinase
MNLFNGEPIQLWWRRVGVGKHHIGSGRSSEAYFVRDGEELYIVRITDVTNLMRKRIIQHEIEMYKRILEHPDCQKYISDLLFAYCPPERSIETVAFFVFRYTMGMPLDALISFFQKKGLRIKEDTLELWHKQMQETMHFLRQVNIVHRDIKPANIFMESDTNRLLLFDFDTSCFVGDDCKTTDFRGTQMYATENAKRLLHQVGFPTPYQYSHADDYHAIQVMFARDIQSITD